MKVTVRHNNLPKEVFYVKPLSGKHKLEVIGLELNVSDSWNARNIINQVKNLKAVQQNP